jgi:uncharacterized membrane protein
LSVSSKPISSVESHFVLGVVWILAVSYVADAVLDAAFPNFSVFPLEPLLLAVFGVVHGVKRYGWVRLFVLFGIIFVVSNFFENLSVFTGFPFGNYHYTTGLGLELLSVPILVSLSYLGFSYVSWVLASELVGDFFGKTGRLRVLFVPLVAAFMMGSWDVCFEPTLSTVRGWWVWEQGGGYFGVPLSNFLGWILTAFVFFGLYAVYLRRSKAGLRAEATFSRSFRFAPVFVFGGTTIGLAVQYLFRANTLVVDGAGQFWQTSNIYEAALITSVFMLLFVGILAAIRIDQSKGRKGIR